MWAIAWPAFCTWAQQSGWDWRWQPGRPWAVPPWAWLGTTAPFCPWQELCPALATLGTMAVLVPGDTWGCPSACTGTVPRGPWQLQGHIWGWKPPCLLPKLLPGGQEWSVVNPYSVPKRQWPSALIISWLSDLSQIEPPPLWSTMTPYSKTGQGHDFEN